MSWKGHVRFLEEGRWVIISSYSTKYLINLLSEKNSGIPILLGWGGSTAQTVVAKQNGELTIEDSVINDGDEIQLVQIIYGG